jgi:hypothetical protein
MHAFVKWAPAVVLYAGLAACSEVPPPTSPDPILQSSSASATAQDRLADLFARSSPVVMALPGTVFADHDEAAGRLVFGIENAAAARGVRTALAALGVPEASYVVEVVPAIHALVTLRDKFRPTLGGIQIHFSNYLCTLGFNADDGTERSFITNSHCTARQGGVEATKYYQPTSTVDGTVIATEVEDPLYVKGGACPKGKTCRYSDASRALYSAGAGSTRGSIAKPAGLNSITVAGAFAITSQDDTTTSFAGTVNKVGRTTGWTQGDVSRTCATVNVSGSRITLLCQTLVSGLTVLVGGGDSGSPVFRITGGDNVTLIGILWGGSSDGKLFVFSPLKNVQDELGPLTATK